MTLSLYFVTRFLKVVLQVTLIFFGILMLTDMVEQLRRFSGQGISMQGAATLALLNVPANLYRILPLVFILAAIALFLSLAKSSELVVVRAAGRSGLRFLLAPVMAALMLGVLIVAVINPLVAATSKEYDLLYTKQASGVENVLSLSENGLWLRQGGAAGQTVIKAVRADSEGTHLFAVTFLIFDPEGTPIQRIEAAEAVLQPGQWVLTSAKYWDLTAPNPEVVAQAQAEATVASELTRDRIRDSFGDPSAISIWALPSYITKLEQAGFSARAHRVWLQMELALPLLLAAMILVAAGFTMRHARFGKTGQMVLLALAGGFAIFFLRNFAQVLGVNGQIPVPLAAWTPPVAAVLLSLGLLLHLEDG
ncbi:lipopolysaccharide export system permease protein [Pseudorhodobacter antarcticus]|uniref:Lipopolysaccharide export system permease protein n=1 Tax=Pseudorhodobacter antarcticus TaxID=1077947 RepID=A0A1H8DIH3_9RHOB|nr:LPS export ABC transporter permease LptG [Pseudorhodobacter antarcticus]SEN06564.1 lipopolysaccharide export system permease protein [Pseudorhodobacter antarcticus]